MSGGGRIKADQWRQFSHIAPLILYITWQQNGHIPDRQFVAPTGTTGQAYRSRNAQFQAQRTKYLQTVPHTPYETYSAVKSIAASRNPLEHYTNVLKTCVAIRIAGARQLSHNNVAAAQQLLSQAFQSWARMGCLLTAYFHLLLHLLAPEGIGRHGPVYATWLWPFERFNKILSEYNTNGRARGELEATMMRSWVKQGLYQDLVLFLVFLHLLPHIANIRFRFKAYAHEVA